MEGNPSRIGRMNPETVPLGRGWAHRKLLPYYPADLCRVVEPGQASGSAHTSSESQDPGAQEPLQSWEEGSLHPAWPPAHSSSELSPKRKGPRGRNCEAPPFGLSTSSAFTSLGAESLEKPTPSYHLPPFSFPFFYSSSFLFFPVFLFGDLK